MQAEVTARFSFEALHVTIVDKPHQLFGTAEIIIDRIAWSTGIIEVFDNAPNNTVRKIHPGSPLHETVKLALDQQFGDAIDEFATDKVENQGGYVLLFGQRLPAVEAWRGLPRRPVAMSRTFQI